MLNTPLFLHNYQITTLINLLLLYLRSQAVSCSTVLTAYMTFESCMPSIMQSGRRPGNEAIGTCHLFRKREGSCLLCLNAKYAHDSSYLSRSFLI